VPSLLFGARRLNEKLSYSALWVWEHGYWSDELAVITVGLDGEGALMYRGWAQLRWSQLFPGEQVSSSGRWPGAAIGQPLPLPLEPSRFHLTAIALRWTTVTQLPSHNQFTQPGFGKPTSFLTC
jgi:hypothetical protein